MSDDSLSTSKLEIEPPEFIDKKEEAEAAFWRLKRAADLWRENRVKRVLAQEGESVFRTLGRVLYVIICILFDGLILIELPIFFERSAVAWTLYILILIFAVKIQHEFYKKWFEVDISEKIGRASCRERV